MNLLHHNISISQEHIAQIYLYMHTLLIVILCSNEKLRKKKTFKGLANFVAKLVSQETVHLQNGTISRRYSDYGDEESNTQFISWVRQGGASIQSLSLGFACLKQCTELKSLRWLWGGRLQVRAITDTHLAKTSNFLRQKKGEKQATNRKKMLATCEMKG